MNYCREQLWQNEKRFLCLEGACTPVDAVKKVENVCIICISSYLSDLLKIKDGKTMIINSIER